MSNWTHVSAIIRIDDLRILDDYKKPDFDKLFGKELDCDDAKTWEYAMTHEDEFLPYGSEGSLQKLIWENPCKNCAFSYVVSIFGDLRDHHDPDEIVEWFKAKCRLVAVRQAVITVENECNGIRTWYWEYDRDGE